MFFWLLVVLHAGPSLPGPPKPQLWKMLPACYEAYGLSQQGDLRWSQQGDTISLADTTIILKGLQWLPLSKRFVFLGLNPEASVWIVGEVTLEGELQRSWEFPGVVDELSPSLSWIGDHPVVLWPSRLQAMILPKENTSSITVLQPLGSVFLDETNFEVLGPSPSNFWAIAQTDSGTWMFWYQNLNQSTDSWFLPHQYFRNAQVIQGTLILALYEIREGVPTTFRLTAWHQNRKIWEVTSSTEVLLASPIDSKVLVARVGNAWQFLDPSTGQTQSVLPVIPPRSRVWAFSQKDLVGVLWSPQRESTRTCFLWIFPDGTLSAPECWEDRPTALPIVLSNERTEIHLCSRVLRLP